MKLLSNYNIKNSKVLIRVDFNVPIQNGKIIDPNRILNVLPTIKHLIKNNNSVVLLSHLGRPNDINKENSLMPIKGTLEELLKKPILFSKSIIGPQVDEIKKNLKYKEILLIENIRFCKQEQFGENCERKNESIQFAKELANHMDFFINEAFACSHRNSASLVLLPKLFPNKKFAGFLLEQEINNLSKIKNNPKAPFTAIIGGAKISSKIKLIHKLLFICDHIILGGAMAHTFIVAQNGQIGRSFYEPNYISDAKKILEKSNNMNCKIYLPVDCVSTNEISEKSAVSFNKINNIPSDQMSVDIGPVSLGLFKGIIDTSKTILWNGPMGIFEVSSFSNGTRSIANYIQGATKAGAYSIIGGGDSIAALNSFGVNHTFSYLSTGGGAMLEFFEKDKLPGLEALSEVS